MKVISISGGAEPGQSLAEFLALLDQGESLAGAVRCPDATLYLGELSLYRFWLGTGPRRGALAMMAIRYFLMIAVRGRPLGNASLATTASDPRFAADIAVTPLVVPVHLPQMLSPVHQD
jgi:hypothetical protein